MTPGPFLHPFARPANDEWTSIVRGEGAAVFDDLGNRYVDASGSLWFSHIGHGNAVVARAVASQMATLEAFHAFEMFTNPTTDALAAKLVELSPVPDSRVFLTSSGSEAVDTAMKLIRLTFELRGRPDKRRIVARRGAYHGVTLGGTTLQGLDANRQGFGPLVPDVHHVDAHDLDDIRRLFVEHGSEIAAVIAEPVLGAGGVYPPAPGYLEGLRQLCDDHDALLVFDEVITGFGRVGRWFASELYGVTPDLITFAKGVTSGYVPLGGVLVGGEVRAALEADPSFTLHHGFTYSGHPVACAAALANLAVIEDEGLLDRVPDIGRRLSDGLGDLFDGGKLSDFRGVGAVWAVGLLPGVRPVDVRDRMLERGVVIRPLGDATLAFCPPFVIEDEDLDLCIEALGSSL